MKIVDTSGLQAPVTEPQKSSSPAASLAAGFAAALMVVLAGADIYTGKTFNASIVYPTVLLVCWWVRRRRFLWMLAALAATLTIGVMLYEPFELRDTLHRIGATAVLLVTAGLFHHMIGTWQVLGDVNVQLKTREHEITAQNQALRNQAEQLKLQGDALHCANEELARHQRVLEAMLRLSRALPADQSRAQSLASICQTGGEVLGDMELGVAVTFQEGDQLRVLSCHGFGPAGAVEDVIPFERSLARLVMHRNHAAHLEDVSQRPDLVILRPSTGAPFASVLAAPLRVHGRAVGTLEIFSRQNRGWSDEQVAIAESLASQTSITLLAAELLGNAQQQGRRLEAIFRTLPIGVAVVDADGRISHNPAAVSMLDIAEELDMSERNELAKFKPFRGGTEITHDQMPLFRALAGEEVRSDEIELVFARDRRCIILASANPIYAPDHNIEGAVVAFADITALKTLQQELDQQRKAAEDASVRKNQFLAHASHDIRNAVNAISLLAELVHRAASEPAMAAEVADVATDLRQNAISLAELVTDVLDLTRLDAGALELEQTEFSLSQMLAEESRGYQEVAAKKGLVFECRLPPQPIVVRGDRVKLLRVLGNLMTNAIKFTDAGTIRLEAGGGADQGVWLRVIDTGPGIAPEFQQKIFDEFFRVRLRGAAGGAGLGLCICKRLIEAMGGTIQVESQPGSGSTFTVRLPVSAVVTA